MLGASWFSVGTRPVFVGWVLGTFFLSAFYRSVRSNWPENYFLMSTTRDPIITRSITHYVLYRVVPVFVCCLFVGVSLDRGSTPDLLGYSPAAVCILAVGASHVSLTNGRALFRLGRYPRGRRIGLVMLYATTAAFTLGAAFAAIWIRTDLAPIVPDPNELSVAAWTAVAVASLSGWLLDASKSSELAEHSAERSLKEIGSPVKQRIWEKSNEFGAEFRLALSVAAFENMQRPPWVRPNRASTRLGHARGFLWPNAGSVTKAVKRHRVGRLGPLDFTPRGSY